MIKRKQRNQWHIVGVIHPRLGSNVGIFFKYTVSFISILLINPKFYVPLLLIVLFSIVIALFSIFALLTFLP